MSTTQVGIKITAQDDTAGAFGSINAGLGRLQNTAATVSGSLAALGIGLSAGAFVAFAKQIVDGIDALNDLKDATGASIENLSALEDIARRTGTGLDTVGTSLVKLNQALSNAKPGSDTERAINAIGLSVKDLKTLDPAEAFRQIAVGLSGFADDANKARLTQELFGKSLKEVAPLLKDVAEQGALVATVTTEQADQAEKLNKQLFNLQTNATAAGRALVGQLVPTLSAMADEFARADADGSSLAKTIGESLSIGLDGLIRVGAGAAFVFKTIGREIGGVVAGLAALGEGGGIFSANGRAAWLTVWEARAADLARDVQAYNDLVNRISGARTPTVGSAGASAGVSRPTVGDISGSKPDTAAIAAANTELKKQADLLAKLAGNNADYQEQLTRLQAIRKAGTLTEQEYIDKVTALINLQPAVAAANKELEDQIKATAQQMEKGSADYAKYLEQQDQSLEKVREDIKQEEQRIAQMGLTREALAELMALQMEDDAALLERNAARAIGLDLQGEETRLMKERAEELRKLAALRRQGAAKEASIESAKAAADEWKRSAEQIESSITDALMRGFENGKPFAQNLRDTIENMFKTLVLRPIVQATVQGALGLDGGSGSGSGGGLGNIASTFASLSKAADTFSFALTDFKTFATYGAQDAGAALSRAGFTNAGSTVTNNASAIGNGINNAAVALSYLEAVSNFKDGTYGQSIGQAIGTAWAGPIGGQIGKALGSIADRIFGGSQGPTASGVSSTFTADGTLTGRTKIGDTSNESVNQFTSLLAVSYQQLAQKLGVTTRASSFDYQTTTDGYFDISSRVGTASFGQGRTQYSEAALQLSASRAVFAAIQGSELPGYLSKAFNGILAETASAEQINGAYQFAESLKAVRFSLLSASEQQAEYQKVIDAGNAALGTSAATFKTDFLAAIDQGLTPETLAQWQALGGTMQALEQITGKASDGLQDLARSAADIANERKGLQSQLDELTLSSADLLAKQREALDESNRALFDQVQTAQAAKAAAEELAQAQADLAATNSGLQDQLDVLTGAQTDRTLQLRDATDESTKALLRQIFAQQDLSTAAQEAAQRASAVASERGGLQDQLDVLTGAQTDRTLQLRDATDESTKALLRQIFAQQDLSTAAQEAAQRASAVASERGGLQDQLNQLTLSNAELLALQRNALDESNRALFDQVQAAQAAKTAAQALADAQAKAAQDAAAAIEAMTNRVNGALSGLTDNRQSLQSQLLTAQGDPAGALALTRKNALAKLTEGLSAADAAKVTASFNFNAALEDQISSLNAAAKAAEENARAQEQAAADAQRAAAQIREAWQSVTDSIFDEVKRIRALTGGGSAQTFAQAQANFSITAAQASAGDQAAAKALPELSKILLELAEQNATSLVQLRAIQGSTAGALETIGKQFAAQFGLQLPQFATGTNYVPQDMLAVVHKGEAIVPAAYNPSNGGSGGNDALVAEVQALRSEIAAMRATNEVIAKAATNSDKTLTRVTRGGDAMQTQVFS